MEVDEFAILYQRVFSIPDSRKVRAKIDKAHESLQLSLEHHNNKVDIDRKLFLCHLINSPVFVDTKASPKIWNPFKGIYKVDLDSLVYIMGKRKAWNFVMELILVSKDTELIRSLLDFFLNSFQLCFKNEDTNVLAGILAAVIIRSRMDPIDDAIVQELALKILEEMFSKFEIKECHLVVLFFSMKLACVEEVHISPFCMNFSADFVKKFYSDDPKILKITRESALSTMLEKHIVKYLLDFNVDSWILLAELSTSEFQEKFPLVRFWPEEQFCPPHLQSLLAHFASECLASSSSLKSEKFVCSLAKPYDPFDGMIGKPLHDILDQAKNEQNPKLKNSLLIWALSQKTDEFLNNDVGLDMILQYKQEFADHVDIIFDAVNAEDVNQKLLNSFLSIFQCSSFEMCQSILKKRWTSTVKDIVPMRLTNYEDQVKNFVNQIVRSSDEKDVNKDRARLCSLAFQDPIHFLTYCINESLESPGIVQVIIPVLCQLLPLLWELQNDDATLWIHRVICDKLRNQSEDKKLMALSSLVSGLFLENVTHCFDFVMMYVTDLLLGQKEPPIHFLETLEKLVVEFKPLQFIRKKMCLIGGFCQLLNRNFNQNCNAQLVKILLILAGNDLKMLKFINQEIESKFDRLYFQRNDSPKSLLEFSHQNFASFFLGHSSQSTIQVPCHADISVPEMCRILPNMLQEEWNKMCKQTDEQLQVKKIKIITQALIILQSQGKFNHFISTCFAKFLADSCCSIANTELKLSVLQTICLLMKTLDEDLLHIIGDVVNRIALDSILQLEDQKADLGDHLIDLSSILTLIPEYNNKGFLLVKLTDFAN